MYSHQGFVQAYRHTTVKTASQGQIIVMLYSKAIQKIDEALALFEDSPKHIDKINSAVTKAQEIITELAVSLDMEKGGEVARNLMSLYVFFNERLMEGNVKKDAALLKEVRTFLDELHHAWKDIETTPVGPSVNGVNIAG